MNVELDVLWRRWYGIEKGNPDCCPMCAADEIEMLKRRVARLSRVAAALRGALKRRRRKA